MPLYKNEISLTKNEVFGKIFKFCSYQERTELEVRQKLKSYGVKYSDIEDIVQQLHNENFLNEERYAILFLRGKFFQKKWGRKKITAALYEKGVSEAAVKKAMKEIDDQEYYNTLENLTIKKISEYGKLEAAELKKKLLQYLSVKGYEYELIWKALNEHIK